MIRRADRGSGRRFARRSVVDAGARSARGCPSASHYPATERGPHVLPGRDAPTAETGRDVQRHDTTHHLMEAFPLDHNQGVVGSIPTTPTEESAGQGPAFGPALA